MITITLNGKPRDIAEPQSVEALLQALDVKAAQVAVAVNGDVVARHTWPQTTVQHGDVVEIVRAVGGG